MADLFSVFKSNLDSPGKNATVITTNDGADLTIASRSLYVGVTGDLNVIMLGDTANTLFKAVPAGSILPIRVKHIWQTGTTANNIVSIW